MKHSDTSFTLMNLCFSFYVCVCLCVRATCGRISEAAGGSPASACQEAIADLLGLFKQLQVLLSILLRELQLRERIFHQVNHITCAV